MQPYLMGPDCHAKRKRKRNNNNNQNKQKNSFDYIF